MGTACSRSRKDAFPGYTEKSSAPTHLILGTALGEIRIKLNLEEAPGTVRAITDLVKQPKKWSKLRFYRLEAEPEAGKDGPPWGLLQGSLEGMAMPPKETTGPIGRGKVCMIMDTREFFISVGKHEDWQKSPYVVWGEVSEADLEGAVRQLLSQPYKVQIHPVHGTAMRIAEVEQPFTLQLSNG